MTIDAGNIDNTNGTVRGERIRLNIRSSKPDDSDNEKIFSNTGGYMYSGADIKINADNCLLGDKNGNIIVIRMKSKSGLISVRSLDNEEGSIKIDESKIWPKSYHLIVKEDINNRKGTIIISGGGNIKIESIANTDGRIGGKRLFFDVINEKNGGLFF